MFGTKVMLRVSAFVKRLFNCVSSLRKGRKNWVPFAACCNSSFVSAGFQFPTTYMFITHQSPGEWMVVHELWWHSSSSIEPTSLVNSCGVCWDECKMIAVNYFLGEFSSLLATNCFEKNWKVSFFNSVNLTMLNDPSFPALLRVKWCQKFHIGESIKQVLKCAIRQRVSYPICLCNMYMTYIYIKKWIWLRVPSIHTW